MGKVKHLRVFFHVNKDVLVRYLIVGIIAYLVEMGALLGLRHGLKLSPVGSVAISFWVGFVTAFIMQKLITFQNYERAAKAMTKQLGGYSLLVAWNYAFTLIAVHIFATTTSVFIIRTIVIAIVTVWNFAIYRILFKNNLTAQGPDNEG